LSSAFLADRLYVSATFQRDLPAPIQHRREHVHGVFEDLLRQNNLRTHQSLQLYQAPLVQ
jgi:hypothetical protein